MAYVLFVLGHPGRHCIRVYGRKTNDLDTLEFMPLFKVVEATLVLGWRAAAEEVQQSWPPPSRRVKMSHNLSTKDPTADAAAAE
jgi:hypothetical protein